MFIGIYSAISGRVESDSGDVVYQRVANVVAVVSYQGGQVKHWHGSMDIKSDEPRQPVEGRIVTDHGPEWQISIPDQSFDKYPAVIFWGKGEPPSGPA